MLNKLADFKGTRRPENAFTGGRLKPAGHALAAGVYGAGIAKEAASNMSKPMTQKQPGIQQPSRLASDMRSTPTTGATGDLAMALSDLQQAEGASGLH